MSQLNLGKINLTINYFEFGVLYASLKEDAWERMPRSLWLKLKIIVTEAYVKHPAFRKSDAKQLKNWRKELQKIEGGQDGTKSK